MRARIPEQYHWFFHSWPCRAVRLHDFAFEFGQLANGHEYYIQCRLHLCFKLYFFVKDERENTSRDLWNWKCKSISDLSWNGCMGILQFFLCWSKTIFWAHKEILVAQIRRTHDTRTDLCQTNSSLLLTLKIRFCDCCWMLARYRKSQSAHAPTTITNVGRNQLVAHMRSRTWVLLCVLFISTRYCASG